MSSKRKGYAQQRQLAPLIAGYCCLANQGVVDDAQISEIIKCIMGNAVKKAQRERDTDADRCFADILNLPLPQTGGGFIGKTVAQHIEYVIEAINDPETNKKQVKVRQAPLLALGMRVDQEMDINKNTKTTLFIAHGNINLINALERMDSYVDYARLLKGHQLYLRSGNKRIKMQCPRGKIMDITNQNDD